MNKIIMITGATVDLVRQLQSDLPGMDITLSLQEEDKGYWMNLKRSFILLELLKFFHSVLMSEITVRLNQS